MTGRHWGYSPLGRGRINGHTRNRENRRHQHCENRSVHLATIGALVTGYIPRWFTCTQTVIQVVTRQCTAGSRTCNLFITGLMGWPINHQATWMLCIVVCWQMTRRRISAQKCGTTWIRTSCRCCSHHSKRSQILRFLLVFYDVWFLSFNCCCIRVWCWICSVRVPIRG